MATPNSKRYNAVNNAVAQEPIVITNASGLRVAHSQSAEEFNEQCDEALSDGYIAPWVYEIHTVMVGKDKDEHSETHFVRFFIKEEINKENLQDTITYQAFMIDKSKLRNIMLIHETGAGSFNSKCSSAFKQGYSQSEKPRAKFSGGKMWFTCLFIKADKSLLFTPVSNISLN